MISRYSQQEDVQLISPQTLEVVNTLQIRVIDVICCNDLIDKTALVNGVLCITNDNHPFTMDARGHFLGHVKNILNILFTIIK